MKRFKKALLFSLVLILFLFLTYSIIESAPWNANRIEIERDIEIPLALGNIT